MKPKNLIGILAIVVILFNLYQNIHINPDVTMAEWVGYKFGFNYNDNIMPKILAVGLLVTYGFLAQKDID